MLEDFFTAEEAFVEGPGDVEEVAEESEAIPEALGNLLGKFERVFTVAEITAAYESNGGHGGRARAELELRAKAATEVVPREKPEPEGFLPSMMGILAGGQVRGRRRPRLV